MYIKVIEQILSYITSVSLTYLKTGVFIEKFECFENLVTKIAHCEIVSNYLVTI
jgi:hypothetical protein